MINAVPATGLQPAISSFRAKTKAKILICHLSLLTTTTLLQAENTDELLIFFYLSWFHTGHTAGLRNSETQWIAEIKINRTLETKEYLI